MNMLTKTTLAAVMLAAMAVSAQAQQGQTRQIQVLAAPGAAVAAPVADQAPVDAKPEVAQVNPAPAPAPAPEVVAPKVELAPAPEPKLVAPKVEPKFVAPIIEKPARKAYGYSGYGHKAPHCH
jgi:hypothetical protein